MTLSPPPRRCFRDGCHEFTPETANHIYCTECGCKRRYENARKRLTNLSTTREEMEATWEKQEALKMGRAVNAAEKNDYLWSNKTWAFFDIETTNLQASIGTMLSAAIKSKGDPNVWTYAVPSFRVGEPWFPRNDADLVEALRDELEKYDYVATYYGSRFDVPYLQTRLLSHGMRPMSDFRHWDLFYIPKFRLKLHSNRLDAVTEFMYGKTEKTRVVGDIWNRAAMGDAEAMEYIVEHNIKDVEELEKVGTDLRGFSNLSAIRLRHYGSSL